MARELVDLGASEVREFRGAVAFSGDKLLMYKANLWCRTATRILKPVARFQAQSPEELYARASKISWPQYLSVEQSFVIGVTSSQSKLRHTQYVAQKLKDAIVDQFNAKFGKRPDVDRDNPTVRLEVRLERDVAAIFLDSSGESLGHRGYRLEGGDAPLNEVLAAGLLLLAGWDGDSPLSNPMCGSGTIAIEAALMASKSAPGLLRKKFAFQDWHDYAPTMFDKLVDEAVEAEREIEEPFIVGSDIDPKAVALAQKNAKRAGVEDAVHWETADLFKSKAARKGELLVCNPPYNERLNVGDVNGFYKRLGDTLKNNWQGSRAFVLTGNLPAAKHIGLRPSSKTKLFNGQIECRFLGFDLYAGSKKRTTEE